MKKVARELQIRQFIHEGKKWEILLFFLQKETTAYKSMLAEITDIAQTNAVTTAEKFQDDFLAHDRMIRFLSEELHRHSKLLEDDIHHNDHLFQNIERGHKKIRRDMKNARMVFTRARKDFSHFLNCLF